MADNVTANSGSGGAVFATDEISSVHYPITKLGYGILDSVTLVSASNGLPVQVIGTPAVTAVVTNAGTFAVQAGAEHAEDAGHSSGHTGNFVLAVRKDSAAQLAGTDLDYCPFICDSSGQLWVHVGNTVTVSGTVGLSGPVDVSGSSVSITGTSTVSGTVATNSEKNEDAASSDQATGNYVLSVRQDTPAGSTSTDGDYQSFKTDSVGRLWVNGSGVTQPVSGTVAATQSGTWNVGTVTTITNVVHVDDNAGSLTVDGTVSITANSSVNVAQVNGVTTTTGNGLAGTGVQRVAIASDNTAFSVNAVQSGTYTVQPGNTANSTPWLVNDTPVTTGGLSTSKTISAASTNATSVKGTAGQLYSVQAFNTNAAARYLKLYNKATSPTVGSDTPVKVLTIPGNTAGAGLVINWDKGIAFGTGIAFATTTGAADSDSGAVALNEIVVNLDYK